MEEKSGHMRLSVQGAYTESNDACVQKNNLTTVYVSITNVDS